MWGRDRLSTTTVSCDAVFQLVQFITLYSLCYVSWTQAALVSSLSSLQVWEGLGVVKTGRQMLGETDPVSIIVRPHKVSGRLHVTSLAQAQSNPGTIRGDFCVHIGRCVAVPKWKAVMDYGTKCVTCCIWWFFC